ncbi:hypothetical protein A9Q99_09945 [Gammaproteobacteria bacterium 45_16_T64]|nr:hypothetical protein A9Q99_09945 [Gammaproteobacteria bacterium 45_16_T64]
MKQRQCWYSIVLFFIVLLFGTNTYSACELIMVYKEGAKEPLIEAKPSYAGVYYELFGRASQRIGCTLIVERLPKKRLHQELELGNLDFYPGASFSKKRAKYLYYIPNGLETGEYGLTGNGVPELTSYEDLKNHKITWLLEIGSSKLELAEELGIPVLERRHQDVDIVAKFIKRSPKVEYFYVADRELIDFFPRRTGVESIESVGLKVHKQCCGGDQPMHMGFSRFSKHFSEIRNPSYDASKIISPKNFPVIVDPMSVAAKLGGALAAMDAEGITKKIYARWFFEGK